MLSVEIIKRSFFAIKDNLGVAWKVTGFWWILLALVSLPNAIQQPVPSAIDGQIIFVPFLQVQSPFLGVLFSIGFLVCAIVGYAMMAIGWHRFLINGEKPERVIMWPKGWPWGRYFRVGVLIFIIAIPLLAVPMYYIFSSVAAGDLYANDISTIGINLMMQIAILIPFTFLGLVLPAIAVDRNEAIQQSKKIGLRESWALTRAHFGEILMLIFIVAIAYSILTVGIGQIFGFPHITGFNPMQIIGFLVNQLSAWVTTLFGVGLLSEIYKEIVPKSWRYQE